MSSLVAGINSPVIIQCNIATRSIKLWNEQLSEIILLGRRASSRSHFLRLSAADMGSSDNQQCTYDNTMSLQVYTSITP